jgi:hypothetical protein
MIRWRVVRGAACKMSAPLSAVRGSRGIMRRTDLQKGACVWVMQRVYIGFTKGHLCGSCKAADSRE